jgi:hypothetical protein
VRNKERVLHKRITSQFVCNHGLELKRNNPQYRSSAGRTLFDEREIYWTHAIGLRYRRHTRNENGHIVAVA